MRPPNGIAPDGPFRRTRASRSLRRDAANIHGVYLGVYLGLYTGVYDAKLTDRLRGAVRGHEASHADVARLTEDMLSRETGHRPHQVQGTQVEDGPVYAFVATYEGPA